LLLAGDVMEKLPTIKEIVSTQKKHDKAIVDLYKILDQILDYLGEQKAEAKRGKNGTN